MSFSIELSKIAVKPLSKIPLRDLLRISERIESLATNPRPPDIKKIKGSADLYRIRSGTYRILYIIHDDVLYILIVDVDHRKDIYTKL